MSRYLDNVELERALATQILDSMYSKALAAVLI